MSRFFFFVTITPYPAYCILIGVICLTVFLIFSVFLFFFALVFFAGQKSYSFKTVTVGNDRNIEAKLRILMRKNPKSEIVVIDKSTFPETGEILQKMQYDFPKIHIISY